jgi:peptide/nickel transport system permease protein
MGRRPFALVGLVAFGLLVAAALLAPNLSSHDPLTQHSGEELTPPGRPFWFGTDDFGRDVFVRCLYGARLSLATGLFAALMAGVTGTVLGLSAGLFGGWVDDLLGRVFDSVLAFPGLLMGLAVAVFLGKGDYIPAVAAGIINTPIIARIGRAGVLVEREKEYARAARAIGAASSRVLFRHLLPNVFPVILVQVTLTVADAILIEAGLSFLGLGVQPPKPSLGIMLRDAREWLNDGVWYAVFPGLYLSVLLLSLSVVSDALADVFDPRRRATY